MIFSEGLRKKIIDHISENQPEIYWDYNDGLSQEQVAKILISEDSYYEFTEEIYMNNLDYICDLEIELLKSTAEEFYSEICKENNLEEGYFGSFWEDWNDDFRDVFIDHVCLDMNLEYLYINHEGLILTHIKGVSYDVFHELSRNTYDDLKNVLAFANINPLKFAKEFGYNPIDFPNIVSREGNENFLPSDIASMLVENNYGELVCLNRIDLQDYIKNRKKYDTAIEIESGSLFVSHNFNQGCCSGEFRNLRDIRLFSRIHKYSIYEDKSYSYGMDNTCGFSRDAFDGTTVPFIQKPLNKKQNGNRSKTDYKKILV
jgi:hypothetical protein